jgi:tetratricopeptide (TPR) repeat protein
MQQYDTTVALLSASGKYDEAFKIYERAIEIHPEFAEAREKKGDALKGLGRTTEANAAFAKATELGYSSA